MISTRHNMTSIPWDVTIWYIHAKSWSDCMCGTINNKKNKVRLHSSVCHMRTIDWAGRQINDGMCRDEEGFQPSKQVREVRRYQKRKNDMRCGRRRWRRCRQCWRMTWRSWKKSDGRSVDRMDGRHRWPVCFCRVGIISHHKRVHMPPRCHKTKKIPLSSPDEWARWDQKHGYIAITVCIKHFMKMTYVRIKTKQIIIIQLKIKIE